MIYYNFDNINRPCVYDGYFLNLYCHILEKGVSLMVYSIKSDAPERPNSPKVNVKLQYPFSVEFEYETSIERINMDEERIHDILTDNGFIISPTKGVKKDMKDPNSIFSRKYGHQLKDVTVLGNHEYECSCGFWYGSIKKGSICPACGTKVRKVGDNFSYTGWIILQKHWYIHIAYYQSIRFFIGSDLDNILNPKRIIDEDGFEHEVEKPKGQPYYGIGMMKFKEKFDEIMDFYLNKPQNKNKAEYYDDIMDHKDDVFAQSIPVYSTLLRPFSENQSTFSHESTNSSFMIINKIASKLNEQTRYAMQRNQTLPEDKLLYDLQCKLQVFYTKIIDILKGKRGAIRTLFGGRCNFSARDVIVGDPKLRIDEITLPYKVLAVLLEPSIVNILHKSYSMTFNQAYEYWSKAYISRDQTVVDIINSLIKENESGRGLPMIINRNPTIAYGSILAMYCVGMTDTYTMGVPLQVLPLLAADFDGDVLNIFFIINKNFRERAMQLFNPRNTMYISRNDGLFNNAVNHQKDLLANINTFISLGRDNYTDEDKAAIAALLKRNKEQRG